MQKILKLLVIIITVVIFTGLMTGCTKIQNYSSIKLKSSTPAYFHKGVYKSYTPGTKDLTKIYFYVFYDENSGHTEESERGMGLPFSCVQTKNFVKFKFGGSEEPEEILKIKSIENEIITGYFENNLPIRFIPIPNVTPDNFDAEKKKKNGNLQ